MSNYSDYKYGFTSDLDQDIFLIGLNEEIVKQISLKKNEPDWLLAYRLKAFAFWQNSTQPNWAKLNIAPIEYQSISYFAGVKKSQLAQPFDETKKEWLSSLKR
jgi:Fe-S cluster assembly protein SufB